MEYETYYKAYLGILNSKDNQCFISVCRDMPINNNYYYPLLETEINGRKIVSLSPSLYESDFLSSSFHEIKSKAYNILQKKYNGLAEKLFCRYCLERNLTSVSNNAVILDLQHKKYFMNSGKNKNTSFKEQKWQALMPYIKEQKVFAQIKDDKIVSMCRVSDVYCKGANLYVYTDEKYRQQGYGKNVVSLAARSCQEKKLLPVYFAEQSNVASIKLVTSLGFDLKSKECCFCYTK